VPRLGERERGGAERVEGGERGGYLFGNPSLVLFLAGLFLLLWLLPHKEVYVERASVARSHTEEEIDPFVQVDRWLSSYILLSHDLSVGGGLNACLGQTPGSFFFLQRARDHTTHHMIYKL